MLWIMEFYSAKMTQQESLPLSLASIISTAGMEVEGMSCHADVQNVWVLLHTSLSYKYLFIYLKAISLSKWNLLPLQISLPWPFAIWVIRLGHILADTFCALHWNSRAEGHLFFWVRDNFEVLSEKRYITAPKICCQH